MFMPFDRQHQPARQTRFTPMADATGTPFMSRRNPEPGHSTAPDARDFRDQADGAP